MDSEKERTGFPISFSRGSDSRGTFCQLPFPHPWNQWWRYQVMEVRSGQGK